MNKLLFKRAEIMKSCEAILELETITEENSKEYDEKLAEVAKLDIEIDRKKNFIELQSKNLAPVIEEEKVVVKAAKIEEKKVDEVIAVGEKEEKGAIFGKFALAAAGGLKDTNSATYARKNFGERHLVTKALEANSAPGNVIVPQEYSQDFIDLLRNRTVIRSMNPMKIGMSNNMKIFKGNGSSGASWVGENTAVNATDASFTSIDLKAKKLMGVTIVTKEFVNDNAIGADRWVRDDLLRVMSIEEDATFLRTGVASATVPTSLKELATNAGNTSAATDTSGLNGQAEVKAILSDIGKMRLNAEEANLDVSDAYILVSPRTRLYLENLVDANGLRAFPEVRQGKLLSFNLVSSNQIPSNLGGGFDESELFFIVPSSIIIADSKTIEISTTDTGSVQVGGSLVSMYANDSIGIKAILRTDLEARYPAGVYYLSAVKWA